VRSAGSLAASVLVAALLAAPAGAQSLGEVAKKEAERRGTAPAAGKVFTNGDLKPDSTAPASSPAPALGNPSANSANSSNARDAAAGENTTADVAAVDPDQEGVTPRDLQEPQASSDKGEDFWRGRANMHKARLVTQNAQIEALKQRLASLPPGVDEQERGIATRALSKAVNDLKAFNDEWVRFQQQARERKVPDAWIR
jgi:hypothetical protein